MKQKRTTWLVRVLMVGAIAVAAWLLWRELQPSGLGDGFASGNGRVEATEVDAATKLAGRVAEIMVDEGDFVSVGEVLARMDTQVLEAQLAQAKAQVRQAESAKNAATAIVAQRESEKLTAEAVVAQREAELAADQKEFLRIESLFKNASAPQKELDDARTAVQTGQATLAAAKSQVASSQAAIEAAKAQVVEAQSEVEAAVATTRRVEADIEDSLLKAPRAGRVQYRIAQVGEVLPAGGKVLNLVDLGDVYLTFFLPTKEAGRVALGQEVRLVIDAIPQYVIPSKVSYVASVAQFTPKTVETESEREKLMFRVKARIDPELLKKHLTQVKTGLPGMAYLRLDPQAQWPANLQINVPQ
jgi:HlyD family secretion protein